MGVCLLAPLKSLWERLPNPETSSSEMLIERTDRRRQGLRGGRGEEYREGRGGAGEEVLWAHEEGPVLGCGVWK